MDVILIGAGVSSMLLAQALVRRGCFRTLRLIGMRRPLGAHRLAYWSDEPTPFDAHADASWSRLRVVDAEGREAAVGLSRLVYRSFPGQSWFDRSLERLLAAPGVELVDARVDRTTPAGERVAVDAGGVRHEADWVFSSLRAPRPRPTCWQRFEGWEVSLADDHRSDAVTLLDFRTPAEGDFRFMYVLPLAPRRLLVEHVSYAPSDHAAAIAAYLNETLGLRGWARADRERGATPIFRDPPSRRDGRLVHIGVAAGLAKPATGYALMRMWRDAEAIAESLQEHGRPRFAVGPTALHGLADRYFLDELERAPARMPELLARLFAHADGDAVLAFLDDRASLGEQLEVALATPGWLRWWAAEPRPER